MVDMDKHACRQLAENGYKNGQWPESYITWEFLTEHPRAMKSGYLHVEWNSIPGLYNRKSYLRTLVIEKGEWDHLSDPTQIEHYWEPTQDSDNFHRTLGLALCWTLFHYCSNTRQRKEYVVLVAVMQKLAWHSGLPFAAAEEELWGAAKRDPQLFPDIYYDLYGTHFTLMHDTGKGYNVGDPQKFLGGSGITLAIPLNSPVTFPQEFRLIERDQDGSQQVLVPQLHGNVFHIRAQALRASFFPIRYYNHLTSHISRCSRTHLVPNLDDIHSGSSIMAMYTVKSMQYCRLQPGTELSLSHPSSMYQSVMVPGGTSLMSTWLLHTGSP